MLSVEEITPIPGEQLLINELGVRLRPFYRDDLPYHNYPHVHDDVLSDVLRLDDLEPVRPSHGRFNLIAAALGHDAGSYLPLNTESSETREERATRLIKPVLVECGFTLRDINEIDDMVQSTQVGTLCETPDQIKLRRADIVNVGGKRLPFLATSVKLHYEARILADEQDVEPPDWRTFIIEQEGILRSLLSQDLSLGDERISKGTGPFNRAAMKNVNWLSKKVIREPLMFHSKYDYYLRPLVGEAALAAIA